MKCVDLGRGALIARVEGTLSAGDHGYDTKILYVVDAVWTRSDHGLNHVGVTRRGAKGDVLQVGPCTVERREDMGIAHIQPQIEATRYAPLGTDSTLEEAPVRVA